jgi:hypothetical protein
VARTPMPRDWKLIAMTDSTEWYWRMQMGLPPRPEDREALRRIAPELFGPNSSNVFKFDDEFERRFRNPAAFRQEVSVRDPSTGFSTRSLQGPRKGVGVRG